MLQSENKHKKDNDNFNEKTVSKQIKIDSVDINEIEYQLLKLKFLKSAKIINQAEFEKLRKTVLGEPEIHKEVENNEK